MAALNSEEDLVCELEEKVSSEKKVDLSFVSGGVPRRSSKESTPGASSSKEGKIHVIIKHSK